jgi:hypothetical protein
MSVDIHRGKWRARISVNRRRIELGRFETEAEARAAYADALAMHRAERVRGHRQAADPAKRFASKVAPQENGCWLWLGAKDKDGYGKFQLNGHKTQRHVRAHRFALSLVLGRWPSGLVLHSCDTPACVNPHHLREGTQSENLVDCAVRGRRRSLRLTVDDVRMVRARHAAGESVTAIAQGMGVSRATLFSVVHRRTWRHVA